MKFLTPLLLLICGCASQPLPSPRDLPDDFTLSLTILPVKAEKDPALSPAWYVVQPDDSLRIALGERLPGSPIPPLVHTLSRPQVREVWEQVAASGLASEPPPGPLVPDAQATADFCTALVFVGAQGRRHSFSIPISDTTHSAAVKELAATLRRLGWVQDAAPGPAADPELEKTKKQEVVPPDPELPGMRKHRGV